MLFRSKILAEGKVKGSDDDDMGWLYQPEIDEKVKGWLESRTIA